MNNDNQLSEGKKRIALEVQTHVRQRWGIGVNSKKANDITDFIISAMVEELFKNYEFNFGGQIGKLKINRYRKKLKPEKEYTVYKRNTEDGNYFIFYKVVFKPGPKTKNRLKYINDGIGFSQDKNDIFDVLNLFNEEGDQ